MFKNFSFSPVSSAAPSQKPHTRHQPTSIPLPPNASEPLTPPLSPLHSPMPSPADASSCYSYFNTEHHDVITSTLFSLSLAPAPSSTADSPSENITLEDVRRQRQLMARQQTSDEVLRELGELVKRVGSSSRKGSAGSLVETSGIQKKSSGKNVRIRRARGKRSEAVGQRVAA